MLFARALRPLRNMPGSVLAAILTLALGVGASTCVFTLGSALLWKPLPYREPSTLVAISSRPAGGVSWQDVRDLAEHVPELESAAAYTTRTWGYADGAGTPPTVVLSGMVTTSFFRALGVDVAQGQGFDAAFERRGANRVMWLSHEFWMSRYHGDAAVLGRLAQLNDDSFRIVGVLPEGFRFPMRAGVPEIYIPLDEQSYCCRRDGRSLDGIARGAAVQHQLRAASIALQQQYPDTNRAVEFAAEDLQTALAGPRRRTILSFGAAAAVLMLVAGLNAAGILLARAAARVREAAIKASLGAGTVELAGEQAVQGIAIGAAAGAVGLLLATWALAAARQTPALAEALKSYSRVHAPQLDWRAAAFSFALAIAAAVAASLAPIATMRRPSIERILRGMANASPTHSTVRARQVLVAMQIACTVVLLGSGGLLIRSLWKLLAVDRGFRAEQIVSAGIGIPEARYDNDEKMIGFHARAIEHLAALPGVTAAAGGAGLPLGPMGTRVLFENDTTPLRDRPRVDCAVVSPGLIPLLGIPLKRGRLFTTAERLGAPYVAVVNEAFGRRHRIEPGARLRLSFYNGFAMKPWSEFEVIGIIGDTRSRAPEQPADPMIVLSSMQVAMEGFVYYAATSRPAQALTSDFRHAIWSLDRNLQAVNPVALESRLQQAFDQRKLSLWLLGAFSAIALLLAAAGLSAAAAASVVESRKEIGIRAALGATPGQAAARVIRESAALTAIGLALGSIALFAATRLIASQLFDTTPLDPISIAAAASLMAAVMLIAIAVPAWNAAKADPAQILRA